MNYLRRISIIFVFVKMQIPNYTICLIFSFRFNRVSLDRIKSDNQDSTVIISLCLTWFFHINVSDYLDLKINRSHSYNRDNYFILGRSISFVERSHVKKFSKFKGFSNRWVPQRSRTSSRIRERGKFYYLFIFSFFTSFASVIKQQLKLLDIFYILSSFFEKFLSATFGQFRKN